MHEYNHTFVNNCWFAKPLSNIVPSIMLWKTATTTTNPHTERNTKPKYRIECSHTRPICDIVHFQCAYCCCRRSFSSFVCPVQSVCALCSLLKLIAVWVWNAYIMATINSNGLNSAYGILILVCCGCICYFYYFSRSLFPFFILFLRFVCFLLHLMNIAALFAETFVFILPAAFKAEWNIWQFFFRNYCWFLHNQINQIIVVNLITWIGLAWWIEY